MSLVVNFSLAYFRVLVISFYQFGGYAMQMPTPDATVLSRKAGIVARLQEVLPRDAVISDEMETRAYECDALTAYKCPPLAVVLPASTQEVSAVLKVCHEMGVPVVPRGSGTSLAGGALPTPIACSWVWRG